MRRCCARANGRAARRLITVLAFELFEDLRAWRPLALPAGSDRGHRRVHGGQPPSAASVSGAKTAGIALLAAVTSDGVPENVALGVALGEGTGGLALLAAIFVSNFPEALVGSASMKAQGRRFILGAWTACGVLLTLAVLLGAGPLSNAEPQPLSLRRRSRPAPSSPRGGARMGGPRRHSPAP